MQIIGVNRSSENTENKKLHENIELFSHLKAEEMKQAILSSKIILSRSGYSTIMDLATLGKKAIFVPTPGQTEQEYLAHYHCQKKIAFSMSQDKFDLNTAIIEVEKYKGFEKITCNEIFKKRLDNFLNKITHQNQ